MLLNEVDVGAFFGLTIVTFVGPAPSLGDSTTRS